MSHFLSYQDFSVINESQDALFLEDSKDIMVKLENAIENKFVCSIYYRGERKGVVDDGYREIEPVAVGVNKYGNTVLRAWLRKGISRRGKIDPKQVPGWRLFRLDRVSILTPTLQKFELKKGYNADDSGMTEVFFSAK